MESRDWSSDVCSSDLWIYIDEIYLLFKNEYSDNYLFELWKRARKWGAIPTGITKMLKIYYEVIMQEVCYPIVSLYIC